MLVFFTMGFVDLVGIASNYVKLDLGLTDSEANIFPSLVFFWFLIFSVPTGMLMNKIGRKKTVMLSLVVTFVSLLIPCFGDGYMVMLVSFSLLGIGNALMQTSLNPLLSNIITEDKLASSLTFGQFVKAIASFLAPYIAMWGATAAIPSLGLGWRVLFPIYMVIAIVAILLLGATSIKEEAPEGKPSTFAECIALLGNPFILLMFVGIMCHVGIDVGTNTTAPKILMERLGMDIHAAAFATSLYFIFRTVGCLTGSLILAHWTPKKFFCCQCRVDGSFDGGFPFVRQQGSAICQHRFGRIWQFERLLHPFLSGFIVDAPTAERSIRLDDYGTFRWNGFSALDGLCF